jgi:hypothetical protein
MDSYEPVNFDWATPRVHGDLLANAAMLMGWSNDFEEIGFGLRSRWAMNQALRIFDTFWKYRRHKNAALTVDQVRARNNMPPVED